MSIMDAFRSVLPGGNSNQPPANPNIDPALQPPNNSANANPTVPSPATPQSDGSLKAIPAAGTGDKSPLDGFNDLWQIDPKDKKQEASLVPQLTFDPKKVLDASKGIDFTKAISPEVMERITKGDNTAVAEAINQAAQAGFAQSMGATTKILEAALTKQAEVFNSQVMPEILRKHTISQELRADNPIFENPAVAPMLAAVESQFQAKYPTATASEISAKAKEYLGGVAHEIVKSNGKTIADIPDPTKGGKVAKEMDWSTFLPFPS